MLSAPFLIEERSPSSPSAEPCITGHPHGLGRKGIICGSLLESAGKPEWLSVCISHSQPTDGYMDSRGDVPSHLRLP